MPYEPTADAPRELTTILHELESFSSDGDGANPHGELRAAVADLGRSLAALFEAVRTERADQRVRIAQLEDELAQAQARLAERAQPTGPAADDFVELRAAAEQLRNSTERLMREAGEPAAGSETSELIDGPEEPGVRRAGGLTVFPGSGGLDAMAAALVRPAASPRQPSGEDLAVESELGLQPGYEEPAQPAEADGPGAQAARAPTEPSIAPVEPIAPAAPERRAAERRSEQRRGGEPIAVAPRPARPRKRFKRRRIDARKLSGIEPVTALRALVDAVDQLWTAGCPLDLVIALTDGGTLRVSGGDTKPLRVDEVEPGTRARTTLTATREQLVPLFGRLELSDAHSEPLLHGGRLDADLLAGWIDRAQRLPVQRL